MYKKLLFAFFLFFFGFLITIYPSKKEDTNLFDYCYSFEKILYRNSLEKIENALKNYETFAKDITLIGAKKTQGDLVNKMIDKYKTSRKSFFISFVPNQFYCLCGYWIEKLNPGTIQSVFYEKSVQKINQYEDLKKEIQEVIKDFNSEYKSIKKEIYKIF